MQKDRKASVFMKASRVFWTNHGEYLLSMVGFAIGLGNAWRFPYIAYRNGGETMHFYQLSEVNLIGNLLFFFVWSGSCLPPAPFFDLGAFMIPYLIMILFVGTAMFFLEVSIGQFTSQSGSKAFSCVPLFQGIGIACTVAFAYIGIYYNVVLTYALHYIILSFQSPLPWTTCNHTTSSPLCVETRNINFSKQMNVTCENSQCLPIAASENYWENVVLELTDGIGTTGRVKWDLLFELFVCWVIIYICTLRGVNSLGKAVYFTALFPYVLLTVLLIGSLQKEGALTGIYFLFKPDWSKLLTAKVWLEAANQILVSLSLCSGGLITLSSFNRFNNNCLKDTCIVMTINTFTSLYAGITIFATLGFMANVLNVDISEVVTGGPGLAFVVYPEAVAHFENPQAFAITFFLMLLTLGFDTMFALTETIATAVMDSYPKKLHNRKWQVSLATCFVMFLLGINIVTQGGFYWLLVLDTYAGGYSLLWAGVIEVIVIGHIYGAKRFSEDIEMMLGRPPPKVFEITIYYITPVIFVSLAISSAAEYHRLSYRNVLLSAWADVVGWMLVLSIMMIVLVVGLFELRNHHGTLVQRIQASIKPGKKWRPLRDKNCKGRYALNRIPVITDSEVYETVTPDKLDNFENKDRQELFVNERKYEQESLEREAKLQQELSANETTAQ